LAGAGVNFSPRRAQRDLRCARRGIMVSASARPTIRIAPVATGVALSLG
jgi:hypothetical protein